MYKQLLSTLQMKRGARLHLPNDKSYKRCITKHQYSTGNHLALIMYFDGGGLNPWP